MAAAAAPGAHGYMGSIQLHASIMYSQALVAFVALIVGKHQSSVSSVPEILILNGFFIALFLGSARLFGNAARQETPADDLEL